jgi:hypothetical protein
MERDLNSEEGLGTDMNRALSNNLVLILHKTWVDHDGPAAHTLSTPLHGIAALFKHELLKRLNVSRHGPQRYDN